MRYASRAPMRVRGYAQPYNLDHRAPNMAHYSERVPVVIVDEHEDIARLVADRIATLIREQATPPASTAVLGLATGSTPIGVYRELIRLHREEGLDFARRRDVQPRRVLPDAAGQHPLLPPLHVGEPVRRTSTSSRENVHIPRRRHPARPGRRRRAGEYEARDQRAPAASTSRSSASARRATSASTSPAPAPTAARAWCTLDAVTRRDAAADFFGEENVPQRGDHDGRRARSSRRARSRIIATGEHKARIVRRAVEGEIDHGVAATFLQRASEHHVLRRRAAAGRPHAHRDALAARRGRVDARR